MHTSFHNTRRRIVHFNGDGFQSWVASFGVTCGVHLHIHGPSHWEPDHLVRAARMVIYQAVSRSDLGQWGGYCLIATGAHSYCHTHPDAGTQRLSHVHVRLGSKTFSRRPPSCLYCCSEHAAGHNNCTMCLLIIISANDKVSILDRTPPIDRTVLQRSSPIIGGGFCGQSTDFACLDFSATGRQLNLSYAIVCSARCACMLARGWRAIWNLFLYPSVTSKIWYTSN